MKLYTEEQVRQMLQVCEDRDLYEEILTFDDVLRTQTPIELPFNEIEYLSNQTEVLSLDYIDGFLDGAWWVKDKIQNGNNE